MTDQPLDPDANGHRTERDTMGDVRVPADALWGASTQRAVELFPISGLRFPRPFIRVLGLLKGAAAEVNRDLGLLDAELAELIVAACDEVARGDHDDHFPVDVFQTGSGTNTNMNANEVVANVANRQAGSGLGAKSPVHPNDHVNMGQSSNDVIPTTIHVAALDGITGALVPALTDLHRSLAAKAEEFAEVVKPGRTHLMDATPVTLGQEFSGYARQVELAIDRLEGPADRLAEVALGGTAVGTGLNAHERFAGMVVDRLGDRTELPLREAEDHFEAQGAQDAVVEMSGALKTIAVSLAKIANDLRWMNSGPRAGLAEIRLPELVPGSSIMPGKVNPVIPEAVYQVAAHVIGNDAAIAFGGATGYFELNTMLPVMAHNLLEQIAFLAQAARALDQRCVRGIAADPERCRELVEGTFSIVTALAPAVGYDEAAEISKEALRSGRSVREVAVERKSLSPEELDRVLDVRRMADGGIL